MHRNIKLPHGSEYEKLEVLAAGITAGGRKSRTIDHRALKAS